MNRKESAQEAAKNAKQLERDDSVKKKGLALVIYDLKQKKLIPTKMLFVVVLASESILIPRCYLT